jgi:acetyltransferase-like isoleucine patch superfamily enzyme
MEIESKGHLTGNVRDEVIGQIRTMKKAAININTYRYPDSFSFKFLTKFWTRFWMRFAGVSGFGRISARLATWFAPPHKSRVYLANMNSRGYVSPGAVIYHSDLRLGRNVFMDDRVVIFQRETGGPVELGDRVYIYRDSILETGHGGYIKIGNDSSIHPRCQLNAYVSAIEIGRRVMIAPNCAFYSYNHGVAPDQPIYKQPLSSKGPIVIDDDAWLAVGVIVLGGVRIGKGSVVGAGSVVTKDVPDGAIAMGVPAKVFKMRDEQTIQI